MATTTNLALLELVIGQALREVTVNRDWHILDALVMCAIVDITNTPPTSPTAGNVWIIGTSPTGIWAGKSNQLAHRDGTIWRYYVPKEGWQAFVCDENKQYVYNGSAWVVAWSL